MYRVKSLHLRMEGLLRFTQGMSTEYQGFYGVPEGIVGTLSLLLVLRGLGLWGVGA